MTEYVIARSTENDASGNPWESFQAPSVARVGNSFDVVFAAGVGAPGNYTGVFVDRAVTTATLPPATLITTNDTITVPGLDSNLDITFASQASQPGISSGGHAVFDVNVSLGSKQILLTKGPSASDLLRVVTYEGMAFTGSLNSAVLVTASPRGIAPNGDIGFRAVTTGSFPEGIWRRAIPYGSQLKRIVRSGDSLRGTSLQFSAFGADLAISEAGELAFTATMSDGKVALFTTRQLGSNPVVLVKIVKEGENFDFTPSQTKVVKSILFHPGAYPMGTTGFVQVASTPEQLQAIGFALVFEDPLVSPRALVLSTVE